MSEWKGVSPRLRKYDGAAKWGNEGVVTGVNVLNGTGAVGESAELIGLGGGERIGVEGLPDGDESVDVPVVELSISRELHERERTAYEWCSQNMGSKAA